ncbi:glycosyltransferase family 4 protein [Dyadobacter frigoris]|uniref:Glycosyltransferase family 4 protein n=1 Tax=Dyadobacter frigoris TaxID=2576211 RepID=A0A4U6CVE8_9BACT|nr:glycosyltransferase family 1 protein [Dyadobacter frigoris]TKT87647.1 glycosyltransferase family 4 protein [Dyadobacter frigoris]
MIRVGFTIIDGKVEWMGGINYLKNLLFALSQLENKQIQPILFVGNNTDEKLIKQFEDLAEIQRDSLFDRYSLKWFVYTFMRDILKRNFLINQIIKKNRIDIFSHSYIYGPDINCYTANWIPDFQHLRLPKLYSRLHLIVRDFRLKSLAKFSNKVILSSYDALSDFKGFCPEFVSKASVIHFVSQVTSFENKNFGYLEKKYKFTGKYFFLPNQFWAHKNHKVAFQAILLAKKQIPEIKLICSGLLSDKRDNNHIQNLIKFIDENQLNANIMLLGLIPFSDVLIFMRHSLSIINPSYFEGWSSTVEEAKSMKKDLILSNIPVHQEQVSISGDFFDPDKPEELAAILIHKWHETNSTIDQAYHKVDEQSLRTIEFANNYTSIVTDLLRSH